MIHFASSRRTFSFAPPYTIIIAAPLFIRRLWASLFSSTGGKTRADEDLPKLQWGPWTSEEYDNVNGTLSLVATNFSSKLIVNAKATEVR